MSRRSGKAELGRGERVLPGIWRLRLPLPWPGVPHCNAWALAADGGIVLVDTGMHEPDSLPQLERALAQAGWRVEDVRLLVCTHAHSDHYGQAATILERSGCELWMHPDHEHMTRSLEDPEAALARRLEVARQSGVPEKPLRRWAQARKEQGRGIVALVEPSRALTADTTFVTDHGGWTVHETPGHAPSHVCVYQPERRLLISGDHLLGRVSLYYDYGWTPDPLGEFLSSLEVVDRLAARLCLPGHGRPFTDVHAHIEANRATVSERVEAVAAAIAKEPLTAFEIMPRVYGDDMTALNAAWRLTEVLCNLRHLEVAGRASRDGGDGHPARSAGSGDAAGPERWVAST